MNVTMGGSDSAEDGSASSMPPRDAKTVENLIPPDLLPALVARGQQHEIRAGSVLFDVGATDYPFIVILDGTATVTGPSGDIVARHGSGSFLGELNLLNGQSIYLRATASTDLIYVAIDRPALRNLLAADGVLSDLLLASFISRREIAQARENLGIEVIGPRSSAATRSTVEALRESRLPMVWREIEQPSPPRPVGEPDYDDQNYPIVEMPNGTRLVSPTFTEIWRALGGGSDPSADQRVDLLIIGGGPAGLGAAVYGASEGLATLLVEGSVLGGQAGTSRRIENYLGFPAGISGAELTTRAAVQATKFGARLSVAVPATAIETGSSEHQVRLEDGRTIAARAVVLATGARYRRLPVPRLSEFEGVSVFYAAGPLEGRECVAERVAVVGGGNSAAQAAIWLARGGALVTVLHRRADIAETMSDYLIRDLARYNVHVRDRSEILELHGAEGRLDGVTLKDGTRLACSYLFLFLGAEPRTNWLPRDIATDAKGFILTGTEAGSATSLGTSIPGIFAVGDVRAGSVKRVATAVGDGGIVVRLVHDHLAARGATNGLAAGLLSVPSVWTTEVNHG